MRTNGSLRIAFALIVAGCIASTASSAPNKPLPPLQPRSEAVNIVGPANDNCANAIQISVPSFNTTVNTAGASNEAGEPSTCGAIANTVWYKMGPFATAQTVELDTFGSNYDTVLAITTGACGSQVAVACNDDSNGTFQSQLLFQVAPATVYYIQLGGFVGSTGNAVLNANAAPTVPTLSPLAMAGLALLLGATAILVLRFRR